jgi:hypothetical protein
MEFWGVDTLAKELRRPLRFSFFFLFEPQRTPSSRRTLRVGFYRIFVKSSANKDKIIGGNLNLFLFNG